MPKTASTAGSARAWQRAVPRLRSGPRTVSPVPGRVGPFVPRLRVGWHPSPTWGRNAASARFLPRKPSAERGPQGQLRRSDRGSPEGSIFELDKGRGSQAPLRPCHTAPQRGSVQGLPGFRTTPVRGGHIRPPGLTSGVCLPENPRHKPVSAGFTVGITAQYPAFAGVGLLAPPPAYNQPKGGSLCPGKKSSSP